MVFPKEVPLEPQVEERRNKRSKEVRKTSLRTIFLRSFLIILEMSGFILFGSNALLYDALASSLDLISSITLLFCLKLAHTPPDRDHPFGHGRIEPLAGLQLSLLILGVGLFMVGKQGIAFFTETETLPINPSACFFALSAVILMEICYRMMKRQADKHQSPALEAEARHFRLDALNSLLAFTALFLGFIFPSFSQLLDHFGALLIGFITVYLGIESARQNIDQIMDKKPDESFFKRIRKAAKTVPGVLETEKIGIQRYGPDAHVNIDIEVDPKLPVDQAHEITQHVRRSIQREWPDVKDVTVHIEPYYPGDH